MSLAQLVSDWRGVAKLLPTKEWSDKQKMGATSIKFSHSIDCQGLFLHLGIRGPTGVRHRLLQASVLLGLPKTVHTTLGVVCVALDGLG